MMKFHVYETEAKSGVSRYGDAFQAVVLSALGYVPLRPSDLTIEWLRNISRESVFHIQVGAQQFSERRALSRILDAGHNRVDVTVHDPPFLTFPHFHFSSPVMNRLSRGFDWYLGSLGIQGRLFSRLRKVFVLTQRGESVLRVRGVQRVYRIPHVVDSKTIWKPSVKQTSDILYFGFIGPAKGLEYALELHSQIIKLHPTIRMHVVGEALGEAERAFLTRLQDRYRTQVIYHGYVCESELDNLFSQIGHVFLPFEQHRYFHSASGSVIDAMKRGRIVWSTPVNAISELVKDGYNGMFLTKDAAFDCARFCSVVDDRITLATIGANALLSVRSMCDFPYARYLLD